MRSSSGMWTVSTEEPRCGAHDPAHHQDLHPGDILLFHNNSQYITQALPAIIESIQSQGYQIVPISNWC